MTAVVPLKLSSPDAKPGYDEIDPLTQWFTGGSATAGAQANGIVDDDRYGLDVKNSGAGGLSLRAISGNATYQFKVDNTSVTVTGGLTITGGGLTVASLVTGTLNVTSTATFTGAATFLSTTDHTGAATFRSTIDVTGAATFATQVTIQGSLNCDSNVNLGNAIGDTVDVAGPLRVTGTATFVTNVTMDQGLTVSQSATFQGNLHVIGSLNLNFGSTSGFTNATGGWSGYVIIQHDGTDKYVPYLSSAP